MKSILWGFLGVLLAGAVSGTPDQPLKYMEGLQPPPINCKQLAPLCGTQDTECIRNSLKILRETWQQDELFKSVIRKCFGHDILDGITTGVMDMKKNLETEVDIKNPDEKDIFPYEGQQNALKSKLLKKSMKKSRKAAKKLAKGKKKAEKAAEKAAKKAEKKATRKTLKNEMKANRKQAKIEKRRKKKLEKERSRKDKVEDKKMKKASKKEKQEKKKDKHEKKKSAKKGKGHMRKKGKDNSKDVKSPVLTLS